MSEDRGSRNGLPRRTHRVKREIGSDAMSERREERGAEGLNSGGRTEEGDRQATASASTAPGSKLEKRSNVAGFLAKAYKIFDNPSWSDVCGWGHDGETVVIRKQIEFAQRILPLYFNHSNLQSFVRQLNMYNFRKVVQDPNSGEFKHDLFQKGNEHLLHLIKRKQSPGTAGGSSSVARGGKQELDSVDNLGEYGGTEKARMAGGIVKEADGVLEELVRLRQWQKDMENTVVELKRDNQTLQGENQMLKGQVAEHASQQLVLQNKMQKILFCMYDVYMTGLRGANAHANFHAASRGITELADSEGNDGESKSGGGESGDANGGGVGGGRAVKNLTEGGAAGSALESGLAQLAALGGESVSGRLNLLDMENPWAAGSGSIGGGAGDGKTRSPSSGSSGGGGNVVGGGALTRNKTWSQSSYEWLRSLRDPDPLGSVASHPAPASSVAPATETSLPVTAEAGAAPTLDADVTVTPSEGTDGDGGTSAATAAAPEMDNRPAKRQRRSDSPAADGVAEVDVGAAGNDGDIFGGDDAMQRAPSFQPNAPISLSAAGDPMQRASSFQPNAPMSLSVARGDPMQRIASFQPNGSGDGSTEGQVWGGGALSRTLSEGANQVVSELGELGHCEGEALSKIDSLGFQLANLLDPNEPIMGLDELSMFGESSGGSLGLPGSATPPPLSGASPSLGEGTSTSSGPGVATGDTDSPTVSSISNSNTISVEDGLVPFAYSGESAAPAVRVSDIGATGGDDSGNGHGSHAATVPDVHVEDGSALSAGAEASSANVGDNSVSNSNQNPNGISGGEGVRSESEIQAADSVHSAGAQFGVPVGVGLAEDDDRGNKTTKTTTGASMGIADANGTPLPIVSGETA